MPEVTDSSSVSPVLQVARSGAVAELLLHRPEQLNALGSELVTALDAALDELAADKGVRALVVAGSGRCFCAGADISELERLTDASGFRGFVEPLVAVLARLAAFPKPSVAAVHGLALGGGLELALSCDLRVATPESKLGLPEIRLGLLPGAGGTQRLPRQLPTAVAKQMLLTGEPISGERAYQLGLVNALDDAPREAAHQLAATLAAGPPLALAAGKRLVDECAGSPLDAAIGRENAEVALLFDTADAAEGFTAFRSRRTPRFVGA